MNQIQVEDDNNIFKDIYLTLTPKKQRQYSENMEKLRKPFLGDKDNLNPPTFLNNEKKSKPETSTANSNKVYASIMEIDLSNNNEMSEISGYFTEGDSYTSTENLKYEDQLTPLKHSTFIQHRVARETGTYINGKENADSDFTKKLYGCPPQNLKVPLIAINGEPSKTFENIESKLSNYSEEEIQKLKAKIIQMELFKQIENKDKVMSQLLEISQFPAFPRLKHLCNLDCEKDNKGLCKKIKWLTENDTKVKRGFFQYIWNTIKYPFVPVSKTVKEKDDGIVKIISLHDETKMTFPNEEIIHKNKNESSNDEKDEKNDQILLKKPFAAVPSTVEEKDNGIAKITSLPKERNMSPPMEEIVHQNKNESSNDEKDGKNDQIILKTSFAAVYPTVEEKDDGILKINSLHEERKMQNKNESPNDKIEEIIQPNKNESSNDTKEEIIQQNKIESSNDKKDGKNYQIILEKPELQKENKRKGFGITYYLWRSQKENK